MRALVTGGTSYLGIGLIRQLIASGQEVHVVVRADSPVDRFDVLDRPPELRVHDGSATQMIDLVRLVDPDIVFHLAGHYRRVHEPDDIEDLIQSNIAFGTQVLEAMARHGVRPMVAAGSYFQHFDVEGYRPLNLYAATKQAFQDVLAYYADAHGIDAVTVTFFDIYGPGDWRPKLMDGLIRSQRSGDPFLLPDEDLLLDLVHVDDAVAALVRAGELLFNAPGEVSGEEFAATSGSLHRLSEIVKVVEEVGGAPILSSWGALPQPSRRIQRPWRGPELPGWRAQVLLTEGVQRYLDAFVNHQER